MLFQIRIHTQYIVYHECEMLHMQWMDCIPVHKYPYLLSVCLSRRMMAAEYMHG